MVLIGVPLLILLSAFVAYGMAAMQHSNSTGLVGWLANIARRLPIFGGLGAEQILRLDQWVTHQIGAHFKAVEQRAVSWVGGLSTYVKTMALASTNVAAMMWSLAWWLTHSEIPRQARAHTKHAEQTATHADAVAEAAMKSTVGLAKSHPGKVTAQQITTVERVAMPHAAEWEWISHHWKALTRAVTAPTTLPGIIAAPRVGDIAGWTRRNLRWHNRRLARLEALLGVTGLAAVLARTLGVSIKCLRPGGNVSRVARSLCGLPTHLLDDLLGILADVWLIENVCVVLPFLETAASEIGTPLVEALTAVGAGICAGSQAPGDLRGSAARLPSPVTSGALVLV
jgi:hypothetical protein